MKSKSEELQERLAPNPGKTPDDCLLKGDSVSDSQHLEESDSTSRIIIICKDAAIPSENRIKLRTNPPTYIELQPGKNVLTVKDYPALKYGFSQLSPEDDPTGEDDPSDGNCQDVLEIDFSHFDGSEMTTMEDMFYKMENLKKVNFENLNTSKVTNMGNMFPLSDVEDVDFSGLDTSNVTNMERTFANSCLRKINLDGFDMSHVTSSENVFADSEIEKISLLGCSEETIIRIAEEASFWHFNHEDQYFKDIVILDKNLRLSYDTYSCKVNLLKVDDSGKKLLKVIPNNTQIISIPEGIVEIGKEAFKDCNTVRFIKLPEGLTKIDDEAFSSCVNLLSIDFPLSLKEVGYAVFTGCKKLRFVAFGEKLSCVKSGFLENSNVRRLVIPVTIGKNIKNSTFTGAEHLSELEIYANNYSDVESYKELLDKISYSIQRVDVNYLNWFPYTVLNVADPYKQDAYTVNGMLIGVKDIYDKDDFPEDTISCLSTMHPYAMIIPQGVEGIDSNFSMDYGKPGMKRPEGLACYVPERSIFPNFIVVPASVRHIEEDAFDCNDDIEYILTPNDNVSRLRSLLPKKPDLKVLGV